MGYKTVPMFSRLSFSFGATSPRQDLQVMGAVFAISTKKQNIFCAKCPTVKFFHGEKQAKYPQKIDFKNHNML